MQLLKLKFFVIYHNETGKFTIVIAKSVVTKSIYNKGYAAQMTIFKVKRNS